MKKFGAKKQILDEFYSVIQELGDAKLTSKSSMASNVVKALKTCLEEANILIFTKSVEIIRHLFKRLKSPFSYLLTRQIILRCSGKYQINKKKSNLNELILSLIFEAWDSDCIGGQILLDFMLDQIEHHKKINVKECFLTWLSLYYPLVSSKNSGQDRPSIYESIDWTYSQTESNRSNIKQKGESLSDPKCMIKKLETISDSESKIKIQKMMIKYIKNIKTAINSPSELPSLVQGYHKREISGLTPLQTDESQLTTSKKNRSRRDKLPSIDIDENEIVFNAVEDQKSSLLPRQAYQDHLSGEQTKRDTIDQKSLLNYSVDSTLNFEAKSAHQIKQELNKLDFSKLEDLEKTLNYLQMLGFEDMQMYFDVVLQKMDSGLESIKSNKSGEDHSMTVRFLIGIFIQIVSKKRDLDQEVLNRMFKIILNISFEDISTKQDQQMLYNEMLQRVDFSTIMVVLRDLYNEFKFEATMEMNLDPIMYANLTTLVQFIAFYVQSTDWSFQPIDSDLFSFFSHFEWDSVESEGYLSQSHYQLVQSIRQFMPGQDTAKNQTEESSLREEDLGMINYSADDINYSDLNSPDKKEDFDQGEDLEINQSGPQKTPKENLLSLLSDFPYEENKVFVLQELEFQAEELQEELEFNEISYLIERMLTEVQGDNNLNLEKLILLIMDKMTPGERDKLIVLLFSQLATEIEPNLHTLQKIIMKARNILKCLKFSLNLVTRNYGEDNLGSFIVNSVFLIDHLVADNILQYRMLLPLIEIFFKGLQYSDSQQNANSLLESICYEVKEENLILAFEKEFISNQQLWEIANDWMANFKQQQMLETDNFNAIQAQNGDGRQNSDYGNFDEFDSQEDRLVDVDDEPVAKNNFVQYQNEENYFDKNIEPPKGLTALNESDDWKIQNPQLIDSLEQDQYQNQLGKHSSVDREELKIHNFEQAKEVEEDLNIPETPKLGMNREILEQSTPNIEARLKEIEAKNKDFRNNVKLEIGIGSNPHDSGSHIDASSLYEKKRAIHKMSLNQSRIEENLLVKSNQGSSKRKKSSFYEGSENEEHLDIGLKEKSKPRIDTNLGINDWKSKPPSSIVTPKGSENYQSFRKRLGSKDFLSPIDQSSIKRKSYLIDQTVSDHDEMLMHMDPEMAQRFKDAKEVISKQKMGLGNRSINQSERNINHGNILLSENKNPRSSSAQKAKFFCNDNSHNTTTLSQQQNFFKNTIQQAENSLQENDSIWKLRFDEEKRKHKKTIRELESVTTMYQEEVDDKLKQSEELLSIKKKTQNTRSELESYKKQVQEMSFRLNNQNQSLIDNTINLPNIFNVEDSNQGTSSTGTNSRILKLSRSYTTCETLTQRENVLSEMCAIMLEENSNAGEFKKFLQTGFKKQGDRFIEEINSTFENYKMLSFIKNDINKVLLEFILKVKNHFT